MIQHGSGESSASDRHGDGPNALAAPDTSASVGLTTALSSPAKVEGTTRPVLADSTSPVPSRPSPRPPASSGRPASTDISAIGTPMPQPGRDVKHRAGSGTVTSGT